MHIWKGVPCYIASLGLNSRKAETLPLWHCTWDRGVRMQLSRRRWAEPWYLVYREGKKIADHARHCRRIRSSAKCSCLSWGAHRSRCVSWWVELGYQGKTAQLRPMIISPRMHASHQNARLYKLTCMYSWLIGFHSQISCKYLPLAELPQSGCVSGSILNTGLTNGQAEEDICSSSLGSCT